MARRGEHGEEPEGVLPVTRRELMLGGMALAGAASLSGCATPHWRRTDPQSGEPVIDFFVHRAEDQVRLRFTFWNARIAPFWPGRISLKKINRNKPYLARVEFPPQHVLERAFKENALDSDLPGEPPIAALLAEPTRLVFEIDWANHYFPLTLDNLLDWSSWRMRLVPSTRDEAAIAPPTPFETSIELPARLVLSPGDTDRWATPRGQPRPGERTELWHARLTGNSPDLGPTLRAVWSPDVKTSASQDCFTNSLSPKDRRELVLLTHTPKHGAEPIAPELLLLTAKGGWLKLRKDFDRKAPANLGFLKSWEHRTVEGRDEYVQIQLAAVLYPFGFSVSVVITTERKLNASPSGALTAFLRQRIQIKFEEPTREFVLWDMPFTALSPLDTLSPALDDPRDLSGVTDWREGVFWPSIGGQPYEFRFVATDHDGQRVTFTAPLLCIMEVTKAKAPGLLDTAMALYRTAPVELRRRALGGAQVATSPSAIIGRTVVGVDQMDFDGRLMAERHDERQEIPWRGFEPKVPQLSARLSNASANNAVTRAEPSWFEPYDLEVAGNHNEVFLVAGPGPAAEVTFGGSTAESGGFLAPRFKVGGVSRINGPFGQQAAKLRGAGDFAAGRFNPLDFFGVDAKIFGGVSLTSIFEEILGEAAGVNVPAILSELQQYTDSLPYWEHSFNWETDRLKSSPKFGELEPIFLVSGDSDAAGLAADVPTMLVAKGSAVVPIFDPLGASFQFEASISNFYLQLVAYGQGVRLKVNRCTFVSSSRAKTRFDIDIGDYELVGKLLSFVKLLQDYLSKFDRDSPIHVTPQGVTLNLPSISLPPILLGAFNLENVRIVSGAFLPFDGKPLEFWFALSSPDDPCIVTVGIFGGGGHIRLAIDAEGVKSIAAALNFGAYKAFQIGPVQGRGFILGGLSYASKRIANPAPGGPLEVTKIDYGAFVHAGGSGTVLGFLSIAIDYHLGLYIEQVGTSSRMHGAVVVTYSFKIGFFKKKVPVRFEKEFAGSGASAARALAAPDENPMTPAQWRDYRLAFA
ncbi:hypothetical protein VVT58_11245 [Sphingobium sp. SJ10-10]|uniref:hypothetical protein n=1 Tax=Sphingobium sp. SJ10-10 TaxID=3114999 RepID=UPI002E18A726|nr:hypothetical protein [Sphingobium sp. SJ10-10]